MRVDLLLLLQQIDIDIGLAQREVVDRDTGRDRQALARELRVGGLRSGLAGLDLATNLAPQVELPAGRGAGANEMVYTTGSPVAAAPGPAPARVADTLALTVG